MKLGVFDSGVGGLVIARAIRRAMPDIDMCYLGDTLHLPYGKRSTEAIFEYTRRSIEFLFAQGCPLIVIACNTASAAALRTIQQQYLPGRHEGRNVIGVIVPVLEEVEARGCKTIGLIGTDYTVGSGIYEEELGKIDPSIKLLPLKTPLLVPLIENRGAQWMRDVLKHYLSTFDSQCLEALILGCTHYAMIREDVQALLGGYIPVLGQDEIIPPRLIDYLERHPEYNERIGRNGRSEFYVSDITPSYVQTARDLYGEEIMIQKVDLSGY